MAACAVALISTTGIFAPLASAGQADRSQTEALAKRAAERIQALQREADRLATEERTLLGDLRRLEIARQIKAEQLKQVQTEKADVVTELKTTTTRMQQLEAQESQMRPELNARLVEMYKLGQARYARLLLSAPDLRQMGQAARMVAALAKLDRERVLSHERTMRELKSTHETLEKRNKQLATLETETARAQAAADRAVQARNDLVADIDRRRDLNAQLVGELQSAQLRLQTTLRELSAGVAVVAAPTLPVAPFRGDLPWPAAGSGIRKTTRAAVNRASPTSGIEITVADGTSVASVHEGVVAYADAFSGFGNLVIVDHGARTFSLYGDLQETTVKKGDRVERGQPVGVSGYTPQGAAGVYFELRIDGQSVDPLQWLRKR